MLTQARTIDLVAAFNASPNPYLLLDDQLRIAGVNEAYLQIAHADRADLIGHSFADRCDTYTGGPNRGNTHQLLASLAKVLTTGEPDQLDLIHYARPSVSSDGSVKQEDYYWSATHTPIKDASGRVTHLLQNANDITEGVRQSQMAFDHNFHGTLSALNTMVNSGAFQPLNTLRADNQRLANERRQLLDIFMQAPGFVAILNGPCHMVQLINAACSELIGHRSVIGRTIREALPELSGQGYYDALDSVYATGRSFHGRRSPVLLRHSSQRSLDTRYLDFMFQPIRDFKNEIVGILVQGHDVTETVIADERQKLMIDELNHRVKNTLATVQSIAMQTARSHQDPATFAEAFQLRILALSHTHDLLTKSRWEGADLKAILEHELAAHGLNRLVLTGPNIGLDPATALSMGMIFHELATNAAKYGALSTGSGKVVVTWTIDPAPALLILKWEEFSGPRVEIPHRKGFGSRLIERNVRHDLSGTVETQFRPEGFKAEFSIPLTKDKL